MCGIAGVFDPGGDLVDACVLDRMIDAVRHRGPDGRGTYIDGPLGFAHARLSIVDVAGGHQPMHNADRSLSIVFNGEIFNYVELRDDLERRGHRFRTSSDTEVILHAYAEKGAACVDEFNGQWAFALWDRRAQRLMLSRDRLGVRPLFYTRVGRRFVFASEIKALFRHPLVARELDLDALRQTFTFWSPLAPRTPFKGVFEVPAGHSAMVDVSGLDVFPYWRIDFSAPAEPLSDDACAEQLLALLQDATRIRLRADVPVGAYLSGGIDSTVVSTLAARCGHTQPHTFSVTFDEQEYDESAYQNEVAAFLGARHCAVRCSPQDIAGVFPDVVWHAERPLLRTAPAPLFLLSRLVRHHGFKVVLTGEGSDEMLGGYDIFKEAKIRAFCAARPCSRLRPLLFKRLYPYLKNVQAQSPAYLRTFFRADRDPSNLLTSHMPRWEMTAGLTRLLSAEVREAIEGRDPYEDVRESLPGDFAQWSGLARAQYLEAAALLPGYILSSQGDRVAMAHGVESRFPFLDHRIVEFAASLPARLKMKALNEKYILKRAAGHLIPRTVSRRRKQPYRAPDARCFVSSDRPRGTREYVDDLLSPATLARYGVFNPAAVAHLVARVRGAQTPAAKDDMGIVGVVSTQLLIDQFVGHFS